MTATTVAVVSMVVTALILALFAASIYFAWTKGAEHGTTKTELEHERAERKTLEEDVERSRLALKRFNDASNTSDSELIGLFDDGTETAEEEAKDDGDNSPTEATAADFGEDFDSA